MKNIFSFLLILGLTTGCMMNKNNKTAELKCSVDIDAMKSEIKKAFKADSVLIYTKKLREEIYFPEIHCPIVVIYNATTATLDFKKLSSSHTRFDNYSQIEEGLKNEGLPIAQNIINKCNMSEFNDLIIEFHEKYQEGKVGHRFICHYKELL